MTLYLDCKKVETVELLRGDNAVVSTEGVTVFGTRLLDEEIFEVRHYEKIKLKSKCFYSFSGSTIFCFVFFNLFVLEFFSIHSTFLHICLSRQKIKV